MTDESKPCILNVDDNEAGRYAISRTLQQTGFEVLEAATGQEALHLAKELPDLILLDINLPDINGMEVCRRIKADSTTAAIPVVHLSATFVSAADQEIGLGQGADGYLTQPVEPRVLVATIRAFLRIKATERRLREAHTEVQRFAGELEVHKKELETRNEELLRALTDLETARTRYFDLYDQAPVAYFTISDQGLILEANLTATTLLGVAKDSLINQPLSRFILPEHQDIYYRHRKNLSMTGEAQACELRMVRSDATAFWVTLTATTAINTGGTPVCRLVVSDITKRKQIEEALCKAHDELEQRVRERTAELTLANMDLAQSRDAAQAANLAKNTFLANMSHEIRTPLNGILGMQQLLKETPLTAEQQEYLNAIEMSGHALVAVVSDILDLARLETGRMELEIMEFDVRERLSDMLETVAIQAQEKRLELASNIPSDVPDILLGDPLRLQQIVLNLLENAVKFTERGEISLEVTVESKEEDICVLHFAVADTGIGIAREKQGLVFMAFVQADDSFSRKHGGTGLGLAIARELVEKMGGKIWVESELGRGSVFHFTARFAMAAQPSVSIPASIVELSALVVAPCVRRRQSIVQMLTACRMSTTAMDSGQATLEALTQAQTAGRPFGVVLIDARAPDFDGFALAKQIKHDFSLATPIIMLLSWKGRTEDVTRCRELGVDAHITLPVRPSALLEVITNVVATPAEQSDGE